MLTATIEHQYFDSIVIYVIGIPSQKYNVNVENDGISFNRLQIWIPLLDLINTQNKIDAID